MEKKNTRALLLSALFHLALGLFLISAMLEATTFSDFSFLARLISPLRKIAWLLAAAKIALQGIGELCSKRYRLQWFPILFFAGMAICYYFCRVPHILSFSLMILAAKGSSFTAIARHTFFQQGTTLLVTVGCHFAGVIKGVDVGNAGEPMSYSLGFNSPNCLMLVGFQLIILYGFLRKDRLRLFDYLLMGGLAGLLYWATQGRIGFACALLAIAAAFLWKKPWVQKLLERLHFFIKPLTAILCLLFLLLTFLYARFGLLWLNELTTFRLYFTHMAISNIGITPFGQMIEWIGQRGADLSAEGYNYNYVDSSYAKALLDYGVIPLILFLIAFYRQKSHLYQKKEYLLILLLIIIEIYCFFESFWIPPIYNTTVFLLKDVLYPLKEKE